MTFTNLFFTAWRAILGNPLRAALTMLGISIGSASVIAMLALGAGAQAAVEASFRGLGSETIEIAARREIEDGEYRPIGKILSYQDGLEMASDLALIKRVEMSIQSRERVRYGRNVLDNVLFAGGSTVEVLQAIPSAGIQPVGWPESEVLTSEILEAVLVTEGRMFSPAELLAGAPVCVLAHKTAEDLFDGDNALNKTIWVKRARCLVIGVLAEVEFIDPARRLKGDPNEFLLMPIGVAIHALYEEEPSVTITAHVTDESRTDEAKSEVAGYLRERHGIEKNFEGVYMDDFELVTRTDVLGAQRKAARTLSLMLVSMAIVSLVVGGIGIMNVMLVSVTERTREIGVRMAVGARRRDIVLQFLFEAMLLSIIGGLLGVTAGVLSVPIIASLNEGVALLDVESIPLAFGVALLTGLVFGSYPAARAAHLDPIEALRYE
jgi:ABC-type antimicrobial peptide transport system permease subunit